MTQTENARPGATAGTGGEQVGETSSHPTRGGLVIARRVARPLDDLLGVARPSVDCAAVGDWYADCGCNLDWQGREDAAPAPERCAA